MNSLRICVIIFNGQNNVLYMFSTFQTQVWHHTRVVSFLSKTRLPCYLYHVCIIYKNVQQNIYPFALNLNLSDIWYHDRWSVIIPQKFTKRKPIHAKNIFCNSWSTTGTFCVLLQPPMEPVNMTGTCYYDLRVWYDLVLFKF